ncbi:MAG: DUF126 domain-containing protein [Proteobacteria bacterium]|nr:DUF126 domain-containing protein [Pseudomonadota bacterium]
MKKRFKGRPVVAGNVEGKSLVTHQGFNTLASYLGSFARGKTGICSDQNNPELYGKDMSGRILCLPVTIGSTGGGVILQIAKEQDAAPAAMLFSHHIDPLAAAGVVLTQVWGTGRIVAVDQLGSDFLEYVQDGMSMEITEDGTVLIDG